MPRILTVASWVLAASMLVAASDDCCKSGKCPADKMPTADCCKCPCPSGGKCCCKDCKCPKKGAGLKSVADHIQDISLTIVSAGGGVRAEGSGVIKTRRSQTGETYTFVWTAAHVIDNLRRTRQFIDPKSGASKTVVEFDDAMVVKMLVENGRHVGKVEILAEVIRYSIEEDLALLRIRKKDFANDSVQFYLDKEIPPLGTELLHVGSLLGQLGGNSMTSGIMSQHGRLIEKRIFDQTTVSAFPGCLTGDTMISMSDGSRKRMDEMKSGDSVICHNDAVGLVGSRFGCVLDIGVPVGRSELRTRLHGTHMGMTTSKVIRAWSTGVKPVFEIAANGKSIKATANHPFVKCEQVARANVAKWARADQLRVGDVVAIMPSKDVCFGRHRNPSPGAPGDGSMKCLSKLTRDRSLTGTHLEGDGSFLPKDVGWAVIESIKPCGQAMTYDMEVADHHNFIANGFVVHNSSGGGVFLRDGRMVGMVVRGAGETFNLIVPVRRMQSWCKSANIEWAINDAIPLPKDEDLGKIAAEDESPASYKGSANK